MLIVIVVIGGLMLLALPRFRGAVQQNDVRGARTKVVTLYNQARANAMTTNRPTAVRFNGNTALITATLPGGGLDTLLGVQDLHNDYGVTMTSSDSMLAIDPRGFGRGGGTIEIVRGPYADTVEISGFGRVVTK
jgi:type II secretory pathway pseudopilin PulG